MEQTERINTIWKPQKKQALAMSCPATELFFGGARGGGKSDFLMGDFLQGASKYGKNWRGIIFRRTLTELDEIQSRFTDVYPKIGAIYKKQERTWYFPNGAFLRMRYLESESDVERYQGHQYTWIGFDELGNYPSPYCWEMMSACLRSATGVPCYQRGTGNPGGVGHGWLKRYFIDNHDPNKIWEYSIKKEDGTEKRTSVCFVPSRLEDNEILMKNDPDYEARLMKLPEHIRRAMRYGDWDMSQNGCFAEFDREKHVIKPFMLDSSWFKFCAMDWGYTKPYSVGWYAVNKDGRVIKYRETYGCKDGEYNVGLKKSSKELAQELWEMAITEGVKDMIADPAIWNTQDDIPSICSHFEDVGWNMIKGNNDRINGINVFHDYLKETCDEYGTPMLTVFSTCYNFIRTIPMLTPNPKHPEDVDTNLEDHIYDETRYALMSDFVRHPTVHLNQIYQLANPTKAKRKSWDSMNI